MDSVAWQIVLNDLYAMREFYDRAIAAIEDVRPRKVCLVDISRAPTLQASEANPPPTART